MMVIIIFLGMLFIMSMQPMMMVSMLILITLLYSYMLYMMMSGYWFSYLLLLVMMSGVLVVFTYMVSLIPNESFESYNLLFMFIFMIMCMEMFFNYLYMIGKEVISLNLWISYYSIFNLFMVSFLFMAMLFVVWLSYMGYGAMRIDY